MTYLCNLVGTPATGPVLAPRGTVAALHHELAPGCFVHLTLGVEGLRMGSGELQVGIPLDELVRLMLKHEPALKPVFPPPALETVSGPAAVNPQSQ